MKNINATLALAILCFLIIIGIVIYLYFSLENQSRYARLYLIVKNNKSDIKQRTNSTPHADEENPEYNYKQNKIVSVESCKIMDKNSYCFKVVNENSNFNENLSEHSNTSLKILFDYLKFTNMSKKSTIFTEMDKEWIFDSNLKINGIPKRSNSRGYIKKKQKSEFKKSGFLKENISIGLN